MRSRLAVCLALTLMLLGSVALFVLVRNARPYVALIRGQFYTPVTNSSDTALHRAFSPTGLVTFRSALWPAVLFILLEVGAAYSISNLTHPGEHFAAARRLLAGFGFSLLTTVVLVIPMWWVLQKFIVRDAPD